MSIPVGLLFFYFVLPAGAGVAERFDVVEGPPRSAHWETFGPARKVWSGTPGAKVPVSLRHRPPEDCTTKERPDWLTLRARGASLDGTDVTYAGRRQQHRSCRS